jgi:organic hydroperoxide reductase OsmC/OhrA
LEFVAIFSTMTLLSERANEIRYPRNTSLLAILRMNGTCSTPNGVNTAVALPTNVSGIDAAAVHTLVETIHTVCPYFNATRGHFDVTLTVIHPAR